MGLWTGEGTKPGVRSTILLMHKKIHLIKPHKITASIASCSELLLKTVGDSRTETIN